MWRIGELYEFIVGGIKLRSFRRRRDRRGMHRPHVPTVQLNPVTPAIKSLIAIADPFGGAFRVQRKLPLDDAPGE